MRWPFIVLLVVGGFGCYAVPPVSSQPTSSPTEAVVLAPAAADGETTADPRLVSVPPETKRVDDEPLERTGPPPTSPDYVAAMHRPIHEAWAWGLLPQLDALPPAHPLNDQDLWTRVEIVLRSDGTLDQAVTVRRSGTAAFDAAARELVRAAAPFEPPPQALRSPNGKTYFHWAFHRDARACGTFGADPFILNPEPSPAFN
jgi:TonB family protein